jgi:hypothetical protein
MSANQPWISVSSTSSSTKSGGVVLLVRVNPGGLVAGSYSGDVVVTLAEEMNLRINIPVNLTLTSKSSVPVTPTITSQPDSNRGTNSHICGSGHRDFAHDVSMEQEWRCDKRCDIFLLHNASGNSNR